MRLEQVLTAVAAEAAAAGMLARIRKNQAAMVARGAAVATTQEAVWMVAGVEAQSLLRVAAATAAVGSSMACV